MIMEAVQKLTALIGDGDAAPAQPLPQWQQREAVVRALDAVRRCRDGLGRGETQTTVAGPVVDTLAGFIQREAHNGTTITAVQSLAKWVTLYGPTGGEGEGERPLTSAVEAIFAGGMSDPNLATSNAAYARVASDLIRACPSARPALGALGPILLQVRFQLAGKKCAPSAIQTECDSN